MVVTLWALLILGIIVHVFAQQHCESASVPVTGIRAVSKNIRHYMLHITSQRFPFCLFARESTLNIKITILNGPNEREANQLTQPCDLVDFLFQRSAAQRPCVGCVPF